MNEQQTPQQQLNQMVEKEVRFVIGELHMQIIFLQKAMELQQMQQQQPQPQPGQQTPPPQPFRPEPIPPQPEQDKPPPRQSMPNGGWKEAR